MTEVIHWYMKCSITTKMAIGGKVIGEIETPIQDIIAEALEESGHWMFTK